MKGSLKDANTCSDAFILQYYEEPDPLKASFGQELSLEDHNLELALGYGYLNLRDGDAYVKNQAAMAADIPGVDLSHAGRMSDITVGLSYFLNKYVTFRLNYHNVHVNNFGAPSAKNVNVLQARVQYIF